MYFSGSLVSHTVKNIPSKLRVMPGSKVARKFSNSCKKIFEAFLVKNFSGNLTSQAFLQNIMINLRESAFLTKDSSIFLRNFSAILLRGIPHNLSRIFLMCTGKISVQKCRKLFPALTEDSNNHTSVLN